LGKIFDNVPGISGGTILGSSEIALILDIPKLIEYKIKNLTY
jgi:two-component system chemotaxis sensor kinase CheA